MAQVAVSMLKSYCQRNPVKPETVAETKSPVAGENESEDEKAVKLANAAAKERERQEWREFLRIFTEWRGGPVENNTPQHASFRVIPKFYSRPPAESDPIKQKLREEARAHFLQRKSRELLNNDELQQLWFILEQHVTKSPLISFSEEERMIAFDEFMQVRARAPAKCARFFSATVFSKLYQGTDKLGRISIVQFFNYVMRKVWLSQTRIGLSLYDVTGLGYLRESDLESYILELIPTLPQLDILDRSFYSFYACTAVRKFFFFLDPLRTGRVRILDILASGFLDDLLELRDEDAPKQSLESNWFSANSVLHVYGQYLQLDRDHNGMLSKQELVRYGTCTLTQVFVDRIFEECLTYEGELDYKSYLDFVLAIENKKEEQALSYLFKLLDVEQKGYLTTFDLNYFFKAIQEKMKAVGQEPVNFDDIKDEIFDMVKPRDPYRITLADLVTSSQGDVIIDILIDLNGFWKYENREMMVSEGSNSSNSGQQQSGDSEPSSSTPAADSSSASASSTTAAPASSTSNNKAGSSADWH